MQARLIDNLRSASPAVSYIAWFAPGDSRSRALKMCNKKSGGISMITTLRQEGRQPWYSGMLKVEITSDSDGTNHPFAAGFKYMPKAIF
jgi:hypothetical protein